MDKNGCDFVVFIAGIVIGIILSTVAFFNLPNGYKDGQIDAMIGNRVYCLDERYE